MNVTDVHDLNRGFSAGCWPRCVGWLRGWKLNSIFGHLWIVAKSKDGGAEESCGCGGNIHVAKVVGEYRAFAGNGTLADISVFHL